MPEGGKGGKRILVTGASGFVGRYVLPALASDGAEAILGIGRGTVEDLPDSATFRPLDLRDREALAACLRAFRPSHILHLAAQASVGQAAGAAAETWRTNVAGLLNLAETVTSESPEARFVFVSSSEVYGRAFLSGQALDEDTVLQPVGPYARTKRAGEELLQDVLAGAGVHLIVLRPFNHIGPAQDERFVVPSFAHQIARIEAGLAPPRLSVGNLSARREFLDVRDVVRAYARVVELGEGLASGTVLNIASGAPRTVESVLEDLRGLARVRFEVAIDPARLRPSEIAVAAGDAGRLRAATGWAPQIPWIETLTDVLEDARRAAGSRRQ